MLATLVGAVLVLITLQDSFEALVLPRRVTRRLRLARVFYRVMWQAWRGLSRLLPSGRYRTDALGVFGPLSLLGLFACWVSVLVVGFALMQWGQGSLSGEASGRFLECLYNSGETFFTLGYGDVTPTTYPGKMLAVLEAGTGFGFMAIVIGYLPVLYQAFSSREKMIMLLDARAGSPPTAGELLRRSAGPECGGLIHGYLAEWEVWSAELLESHLSFPVLSFYRSQHNNQSWLAAITMVLDASATLLVTGSQSCRRQAELTFAMARHACVDLCLVFWLPPVDPAHERLTAEELESLVSAQRIEPDAAGDRAQRLNELRKLYEPFLAALSRYFDFPMPRFLPEKPHPDNWQTSAWTARAPGITELPGGGPGGDHFG